MEIIEGFRPVAEAIIGDLKTLTDPEGDILYSAPNNAQLLDNTSLAEWFDRRGISGTIRDLLSVAYVTEYGMEMDKQSCLNMLWLIGTDLGETGDQFSIYGESDERFRIREGSDNLPRKIGPTTTAQTAHFEIGAGGDQGTQRRRIRADIQHQGHFRKILKPMTWCWQFHSRRCAMSIFRMKLPPLKRKAIDELGYGNNTKLMLGSGTQVWRKAGSNGSVYTDLPFQSSWETSRGQGNTFGILTNFSGGDAATAIGAADEKEAANGFLDQYAQILASRLPTTPSIRGWRGDSTNGRRQF